MSGAAGPELADKYQRMCALRATLGRGTPSVEHKALLRALARDFPGALRELETLDTTELERRAATVREVAAGAPAPPWVAWVAAYHELMRRALALRGGAPANADEDGFATAVLSPRHGRMNVVVFSALATRFGVPAEALWEALFPLRGSTRLHRR